MVTRLRPGRETRLRIAGGLVLLLASGGAAAAQSGSSTFSSFNKSAGSFESPVNVSTRDANGNFTIVDGVMQAATGSIFANASGVGASTSSSGTGTTTSTGASSGGTGSALAIGNSLNVVVTGDNNTVIVNSSQTNNGAVSATTVLNGKVNLDAPQ